MKYVKFEVDSKYKHKHRDIEVKILDDGTGPFSDSWVKFEITTYDVDPNELIGRVDTLSQEQFLALFEPAAKPDDGNLYVWRAAASQKEPPLYATKEAFQEANPNAYPIRVPVSGKLPQSPCKCGREDCGGVEAHYESQKKRADRLKMELDERKAIIITTHAALSGMDEETLVQKEDIPLDVALVDRAKALYKKSALLAQSLQAAEAKLLSGQKNYDALRQRVDEADACTKYESRRADLLEADRDRWCMKAERLSTILYRLQGINRVAVKGEGRGALSIDTSPYGEYILCAEFDDIIKEYENEKTEETE